MTDYCIKGDEPMIKMSVWALLIACCRAADVPKTWDDAAVATLQLPLADARHSPVPISADYYYRMPVRLVRLIRPYSAASKL